MLLLAVKNLFKKTKKAEENPGCLQLKKKV